MGQLPGGYVKKEFDYHDSRWKRKSSAIKLRDKYRCVWCARYGKRRQAKVVHHLKPVEDFPELAWNDDNLVSLCLACHNKAHPEKIEQIKRRRMYPPTP